MEDVISTIDKKLENPDLIGRIALDYTHDESLSKKVSEAVRTAGRFACLLDLYYETDNEEYLSEAQSQREILLSYFSPEDQEKVKRQEEYSTQFFAVEKELERKVREKAYVSDEEIETYISWRAADAFGYSLILRLFTGLDLADPLHTRQMLADIERDLNEYKEDIQNGHLNVLLLTVYNKGFFTPITSETIPQKVSSIKQDILSFASGLVENKRKIFKAFLRFYCETEI